MNYNKILADIIRKTTEVTHSVLSPFVSEEKLASWKPIHLCAWYDKIGEATPTYFIGTHVTAPTVTTGSASNTDTSSFDMGGNITDTGGSNATVRGFAYVSGAGGTPTTADTVVNESGSFGTGAYSLNISGLSASTTYSVRAYATNSAGTGYGSTVEVTTSANTPPTVALNSPADASSDSDTTPTLSFTGTDSESDDIRYNVQIDTVNTFDSQGSTPLIDKVSGTDSGFSGSPDNTDPFTSGQQVSFTAHETNTYYFDSSDATISQSGGVVSWSNITNADDGDVGTDATVSLSAFQNPDEILIEGTNAPSSGETISQVRVRAYGSTTNSGIMLIDITTNGDAEEIYSNLSVSGAEGWTSYATLTEPTGGWSWSVVQALEARIQGGGTENASDFTFSRVEIEVASEQALSADTYYWRVRGIDPSGSNTYGSWSSTRSFEVTGGATLLTNDISHSFTLDNTTINQNHVLTTQDIEHGLTLDNATINQNHILAPADIEHGLTVETTTVDVSYSVETQDIEHGLTLDNTTITQNHVITPDDIVFSLTEDNGGISQNHIIATQDIEHSLTLDNTTVVEESTNYELTIQDIQLGLTEDLATISLLENYTAEDKATLPTNDADLATAITVSSVNANDNTYYDTTGNNFVIHQFKLKNTNSTDTVNAAWHGKTNLASATSTVYLQIYNQNTTSWETLDTDTATAVDTEFTLSGSTTANHANYYNSDEVSLRVYQEFA